jgi:hypothetical protein
MGSYFSPQKKKRESISWQVNFRHVGMYLYLYNGKLPYSSTRLSTSSGALFTRFYSASYSTGMNSTKHEQYQGWTVRAWTVPAMNSIFDPNNNFFAVNFPYKKINTNSIQ